jgi:hypothetical protein
LGIVPVVRRTEVVTGGVDASFKEKNRRPTCGVGESMSEKAA